MQEDSERTGQPTMYRPAISLLLERQMILCAARLRNNIQIGKSSLSLNTDPLGLSRLFDAFDWWGRLTHGGLPGYT